MVLLKISRNSKENTSVGIFFSIKLQVEDLQLFLKRDSGTGDILLILQNFLQTPFLQNNSGRLLLDF